MWLEAQILGQKGYESHLPSWYLMFQVVVHVLLNARHKSVAVVRLAFWYHVRLSDCPVQPIQRDRLKDPFRMPLDPTRDLLGLRLHCLGQGRTFACLYVTTLPN